MPRFTFPARFAWSDDDRVFLVTFPDVPEAITTGATIAEALANAEDALEEAIAAYINQERDLPIPGPLAGNEPAGPLAQGGGVLMRSIVMGPLMAAKAALYDAWRHSGLGKVAFAERLGVAENEVRRLLNPRHATKIDRLDEALRTLGRRLVVTDVEVRAA